MKQSFTITSKLRPEHRPALEQLLFFNPQQDAIRERIVATIEQYGIPDVVARDGALRISLGGRTDVQSLFAIAGSGDSDQPVGVAVFVREGTERFVVVHVGVAEAYGSNGPHRDEHLLFHLVQAIRSAARRTRGVRYVDLFYGAGRVRQIPV